ncbi:winged helix-turn-helix transcriptional regulator [Dactylosporangium aurantiacum]|uniref:Winged helix-turn-helix transcriptional regulator n=1 Tax=Dactylosporangium aurantiacum TaxID=35754 RepID=A0A9Q9MMY9_9ACTN|nr:MarR family winged helix-turn-helix transcriptional regulator [Dactylosporangium aurantiacum]MDG6107719.1 MarR family winged helix-turn-helix transcriptional regulator [Dactylosporangium aurantiacum]UWZ58691.1 winged helix-turn-helix transcriptional regulator [Dactylosporangium aurantiacum]
MLQDRGARLYEVLAQIRPLVLNSARAVEASLKPLNLTVGMRAVLETLADHGPTTVPSLGARLDLARQGVQRHVNDLLDRGYVESRVNPGHRRSVLIALTNSGADVIRRIAEDERRHLSQMAQDCTDQDVAAAVKVLRSLNHDVRQRARHLHDEAGDIDDQRP